ncbi:MAG: hypothetical protein Q4F65_13245 [Propionibacteriaceae bacterium]|nr:hypothetical protein [Propionibacteriaceae bacterium]
MIRTTSITVSASCDGYACGKQTSGTGASAKQARDEIRAQGWTVTRSNGVEWSRCRACEAERQQLVRAGVITKNGLIRDSAAHNVWLDAHTPDWARLSTTG